MPNKKVTWGECLKFTSKTRPGWQGAGRYSALLYSGKFTDLHTHQFDVTKITSRMILEDCYELQADGGNGKPMKNASLNRYVSAVSAVLNHSQSNGLIANEYVIPRFQKFNIHQDAQERFAYTAEELHKMYNHALNDLRNQELAEIILFAALTGIRQDKILRLRPDRVDLDQKLITITKPKNQNVAAQTCGIHESLVPMLVRRCNENRTFLFGDDWSGPNALRRRFQKCLLFIGKPCPNQGWTFHGLRHTCGTLLYQSGVHIFDIAKQLGHSSTKVTERYMHANDKQLANKINAIDFGIA